MAEIIKLGAHNNMSVEECLKYCVRHHDELENVIILGKTKDDKLAMYSSNIGSAEAVLVFLAAIDSARGK